MMSHETMLSRSGRTNVGGKLDRRLDILVSEELESAVITMAGMHGIPKGEMARTLLEKTLFGELPMMRRIAGLTQHKQADHDGINVG